MIPFHFDRREQAALFQMLAKWSLLGAVIGALAGSASALFLLLLDRATALREVHPALLFGLPVAGLAIALTYGRVGASVAAGSNLIIERAHTRGTRIPFRLLPLILGATVVTHLFGGSAGREGTAIQMGGTLASLLQRPFRLARRDHKMLVTAGISAGFGSVFGVPLAGAVFGLEVKSVGQLDYEALVPCLVASVVGDLVCRAWGVHHAAYMPGAEAVTLTSTRWLFILALGVLCALAVFAFTELTDGLQAGVKRWVPLPELRPVIGGLTVIGLTYLVGTRDYLGLSLPLIRQSLAGETVFAGAFALKLLFTVVTLGSGFKGGEVTPLFCIGATLGAAFAHLTGQPTAFFAALGFVAVFAGAANTPLACIIMGIEMFGASLAVPLAVVCVTTYVLSGERGIYSSQQIGRAKARFARRKRKKQNVY